MYPRSRGVLIGFVSCDTIHLLLLARQCRVHQHGLIYLQTYGTIYLWVVDNQKFNVKKT